MIGGDRGVGDGSRPVPGRLASQSKRPSLIGYAWLSLVAGIAVAMGKFLAYRLTGSVGLLSDALESLVNVTAAIVALLALWYASRPPDTGHPFGHGKAEYFASSFEGAMILIAAGGICLSAWDRLHYPVALDQLDWGLAISSTATVVNGLVAYVLLRAGRRFGSIVLEADGRHLMTDVWTSVGVIAGLLLAQWSGWQVLDPVLALVVAVNIVWSGVKLLGRSFDGLLDAALPPDEYARIDAALDPFRRRGIGFHELRSRRSGVRRFVDLHVIVSGGLTVREAHDLAEEIEQALQSALPNVSVSTHVEPREDPRSFLHAERVRSEEPPAEARRHPSHSAIPVGRHARYGREPARSPTPAGWLIASVGWAMLLGGTALSMLVAPPVADVGLAVALVGFVSLLVLLRRHH